jgi:hypothetical protein
METVNMDIVLMPFESKLIFMKDEQKIQITAFLTEDQGISVDREEIHIIKQNRLKKAAISASPP